MLTTKIGSIGTALSKIDREAGPTVLVPLDVANSKLQNVDLAKSKKLRRVSHICREALACQIRKEGAL